MNYKKFSTNNQSKGSTWKPMYGPSGTVPYTESSATCQCFICPCVCHLSSLSAYLPSHRLPHVIIWACDMSPLQWWHVSLSDWSIDTFPTCHPYVCPVNLPCQLYRPCHIIANCSFHVICTVVRPVQLASMWHCTDCTIIIFCLLEK
jgi:hypothetical protein